MMGGKGLRMQRRVFLLAAAGAAVSTAAAGQNLTLRPIQPENPLEQAFVAALDNEIYRPVFRRRLVESQVALALLPDGEPRILTLHNNVQAAAIFTSRSRLTGVLGANAPNAVMTGRAALERVSGRHVVVNYRLMPMLTLEPADVARFLEIGADTAPPSSGPTP